MTAQSAWDHVAGLTVGQDLSERNTQLTGPAPQFSLGKSFPGFAPIGPWLVTPDEFENPDDLELRCAVNGEEVQKARTSELIFSVPLLIARLCAVLPLLPGDVVFTGTPAGVGLGRSPQRWLAPGDELVSTIEGIGYWYCAVLDGHTVYQDDALCFITFDEEHHRVALLTPPVPLERKTPTTAAAHHVAYTFVDLDDLLARYELLRGKGIEPAVCIAHGVTTSMYYRDPDGNFVEMQIDNFAEPDQATGYMHGPEYHADSVGPAFDPVRMLTARRGGANVEDLIGRSWALRQQLPDPMLVLSGADS